MEGIRMLNIFGNFAAEEAGPAVHIAPGGVLHIGGLTITNSILYGWICSLILIIIMVSVARKVTVRPKRGFVQYVEAGVEFITNLVTNSFDDKERGRKYVPYFVTLFFFLLFNNWLGLLPGVGEAFTSGESPFVRPFTADLNGTLAAAVVTMGMVYVSSVREAGSLRKFFGHFFVGSPLNPMYLVLGLLEMLTDLTRVLSLALRLFLNVAIGEIVIAVFSFLGHVAAPITAAPFTLIELFVGALQAYIFVILSVMYLAIAVNHNSHSEEEHLTESDAPETMKLEPNKA
jgi:F-type H+-transporting ATPase subunit a